MKDIIDILWSDIVENSDTSVEAKRSYSRNLNLPSKYKNSGGYDLFGYDSKNMIKLIIQQQLYKNKSDFQTCLKMNEELKLSLDIQNLSMNYLYGITKNKNTISYLKDLDLIDTIMELYKRFSNKTEEEILGIVNNWMPKYGEIWDELIDDELNVTEEELEKFYNSFPFPCGCIFSSLLSEKNLETLSLAYKGLPIELAKSNNSKNFFDYGGNSGMLTSSANALLDIPCTLFETNEELINFAKWRDNLFNLNEISYYNINDFDSYKDDIIGTFDFGVCTEVAEHVIDVEGLIKKLSELLCEGGILFFSSSFGLPQPLHLPQNVKYYGHEDELMLNAGLKKMDIEIPMNLLHGMGIYQKI